jgi:hypothetical protein
MQYGVRVVAVALTALFLVSCGGGADPGGAPPMVEAVQAMQRVALPMPRSFAASTVTVGPDALMDWAEGRFPAYFPEHEPDQTLFQYVYRAYSNGIYLGVDTQSQSVVVMGGPFGGGIVPVGQVADYACAVAPSNCPVLSGVAAKGSLAGAALSVYNLNADGSTGGLLASGTTQSDGRFSITLPWQSTGPVVLQASGGRYQSAYDGSTVVSHGQMQALLTNVSQAGESGLSINPLSDMSAALARSYVASGYDLASAVGAADQWVAWHYGLKSAPARIVPHFDVTAVTTDAQAVHLALVLVGLDTLSKRLAPTDPDAVYADLALDFADGVFDGRSGGTPLTLDGAAWPVDAGTKQFEQAFAVTFTASASGLRPWYLDTMYAKGVIAPNYQATIIPVYESSSIAPYFPASYVSPLPNTTSTDISATGYSCPAGAPVSFDSAGAASCGSYSTCGSGTLSMIGGSASCSDGSLPIFHSATIAVYTAPSIAVYTAPAVPSYTATTPDSYLAQTTIGDPGSAPIAVFHATPIHLLTDAERQAMIANDTAAGDAAAAEISSLGTPTQLQLDWLGKINSAVFAAFAGH